MRDKKTAIVIGAGVIGITCALELQKRGHRVTLIDRGGPGEGTSIGNAGHIATEIIDPLASPSTLYDVPKLLFSSDGPLTLRWQYMPKLLPWLLRFLWSARPSQTKRGQKALTSLSQMALPCWRTLLKDAGHEGMIGEKGSLQVFETEKAFKGTADYLNRLSEVGVSYIKHTGDEARARVLGLSEGVVGAIEYPGSPSVSDPYQLSLALFETFIERGGNFIEDEIKALAGTSLAGTGGKTYSADTVLVCAGAWSNPFLKSAGYKVPLDTERGYHIMMPEPSLMPEMTIASYERKFIITPMSSGLRVAGLVELGGLKLEPTYSLADGLYTQAQALLPGLEAQEKIRWMGFRPTLPDSLPVIDKCRRTGGLYFAFGHQHLGLTFAAVTAKLVGEMVMREKPSVDLSPFRIDRF